MGWNNRQFVSRVPDSQIRYDTRPFVAFYFFHLHATRLPVAKKLKFFSRGTFDSHGILHVWESRVKLLGPLGRDITRPGNRNWLRRYHGYLRRPLLADEWKISTIIAAEHRGKYHRKSSILPSLANCFRWQGKSKRAPGNDRISNCKTRVSLVDRKLITPSKSAVSQLYLQRPNFICPCERNGEKNSGGEISGMKYMRGNVVQLRTQLKEWKLNITIGMWISYIYGNLGIAWRYAKISAIWYNIHRYGIKYKNIYNIQNTCSIYQDYL